MVFLYSGGSLRPALPVIAVVIFVHMTINILTQKIVTLPNKFSDVFPADVC